LEHAGFFELKNEIGFSAPPSQTLWEKCLITRLGHHPDAHNSMLMFKKTKNVEKRLKNSPKDR
jgi:hypothetical protein